MDLNEKEASGIDQFVSEKALISPVITAQNLCSINSCPDQQMYRARIQFLFQLEAYVQDENGNTDQLALEALIDMVHDAILFSADNSLPYAKSIIFLTIFIAMIQNAISSPFYEPERLYSKLENLLLTHSIDRPPFSAAIFDLPDLKIINEYFISTFFRNLKLFLYCFTPKPILEFKSIFPFKAIVPIPPPLSEMEMEIQSINEEHSKEINEKTVTSSRHETIERSAPKILSEEKNKNIEHNQQEPEDKSPEVPVDILKTTLNSMHEKFVIDFEEKEKLLMGKIKEIEIRLLEKQNQKKTPIKPKNR